MTSASAIALSLIYLLIGSLIWAALDGGSVATRATTWGRAVSFTAAAIMGWPWVAWVWVRAMARKHSTTGGN